MRTQTVFIALAIVASLSLRLAGAKEDTAVPICDGSVAPREFAWKLLAKPESVFWPAYFWSWNGPLSQDVLTKQLDDMFAHDARSVCAMPMPHEFRPDIMNNRMDTDYLSPEFFERVRIAVDKAAQLGMNYWLYDEGGWPSGQATGRVLRAEPKSAAQVLTRNSDGTWTLRNQGRVDLLNPKTTETFIRLTHQRYADAVGQHFGKTIHFLFTDEPGFGRCDPNGAIPWPQGSDEVFRQWFGYSLTEKLESLRGAQSENRKPEELQAEIRKLRIDLFDFCSRKFHDAYLSPLQTWGRRHGLASGGHLNGEDETIGAARHGFGQIMRQLRTFDVPGVDAIWRQIFPGNKANHHFPKFASSAAHQNGTAMAFTESFCVYGNGLTPAQMKWVVDYQYVRGLTLLVCGLYPLCTQDHLMMSERPHFGPGNPLWDFLPDFHRYAARLGYVLACGQPDIGIGLYYPVRDVWASGDPADPALRGHDALARALSEHQCDFDVVDDDVLADSATRIENGRMAIGPMRYHTIVVGPTHWMPESVQKQLEAFKANGGRVVRVDDLGQIDNALAGIPPTVQCNPVSPGLRVLVRRWKDGGAVFLFNEGEKACQTVVTLKLDGQIYEVQPTTGTVSRARYSDEANGTKQLPISLMPGESRLLVAQPPEDASKAVPSVPSKTDLIVDLVHGWTARVDRRYVIGEHDYEVQASPQSEFKPVALGRWATTLGLGEDFSGHVTYRQTVPIPEAARGKRMFLSLPGVEYAARVSVDGKRIGCVLWSPWQLELPPAGDRKEFVLEIEVANTFANELTSARVRDAWAKRTGPGWPSCYHKRALDFEVDSRGGGLLGPVHVEFTSP